MRTKKDIVYSNISLLDKLDIYYAEKEKAVIIYFHGGGFECGDKYDLHLVEISESFASKGYTFVNVNYSLYPNTKFPSYLVEGAKAIKYVLDEFKEQDIYISGTSAGAYIAMMLCFNKEYFINEGIDFNRIKGWIFESGQPTSHFNIMKKEKGLNPLLVRIDELAPLYYVNENLDTFSSLFILYDNDIVNRYEQNQLLISSIKSFNPSVNISEVLLHGSHCEGSAHKDIDNEYPFVKEIVKWIERK